jgi:hypothetical protein
MIQQVTATPKTVVQTHLEALRTSSRLTSYFREKHQPMATDVTPQRVIEVLNEAGIKCVLMGTHALNTYRDQARATQDVDVLVRKKDVRKAVRLLHQEYPELTLNETPVVTRFIDPTTGKAALDVMKPTQKVFQMVFRHTVKVADTHHIPDLEMALISKFAAITSPHRERQRKIQDVADFANIVENCKSAIDMLKLRRLAKSVYPAGGEEICKLVEDILTGRPLVV